VRGVIGGAAQIRNGFAPKRYSVEGVKKGGVKFFLFTSDTVKVKENRQHRSNKLHMQKDRRRVCVTAKKGLNTF